jgi:hypothetical protein
MTIVARVVLSGSCAREGKKFGFEVWRGGWWGWWGLGLCNVIEERPGRGAESDSDKLQREEMMFLTCCGRRCRLMCIPLRYLEHPDC